MFNINTLDTITRKSSFLYWFKRIGISTSWNVISLDNDEVVAKLDENISEAYPKVAPLTDDLPATAISDITQDFQTFKLFRPEYRIGGRINKALVSKSPVNDELLKLLREEIDAYIIACCYAIYKDDDVAQRYASRCLTWLAGTDFYTAPASTKYHDNEPGGLVRHTLRVIDKTLELSTIDTYNMVGLAEAILAAIVHDWCKIDFYEPYQKNVKNEKTGAWEQVLAYRYKGSALPFGHGVTSMFIAMKLFKLTTEQALAIRWHMNEYDVSDYQKQDLMDANEKYPMVTMLQTADRLSIM